jgi:hypothetical protein
MPTNHDQQQDTSPSGSLSEADYAKKKQALERSRADRATKGEPTSGLPADSESGRAEDMLPPQGQTNQTR